jgi:hypothetical protein
MTHSLLVSLSDLPQAYTCNDLWYRFRDVMVAIGARPTKILTYDCADKVPAAHASPRVELGFRFPTVLSGANERYADFRGSVTAVRLTPGNPRSLTADDCELMRQITSELFHALELPVSEAHFTCAARPGSSATFAVTVQALLPQAVPHS